MKRFEVLSGADGRWRQLDPALHAAPRRAAQLGQGDVAADRQPVEAIAWHR
jgi:hypothetical protein